MRDGVGNSTPPSAIREFLLLLCNICFGSDAPECIYFGRAGRENRLWEKGLTKVKKLKRIS